MQKGSPVPVLAALNACLLAAAFVVTTPSVSYAANRDCGECAEGETQSCVGGLDHDTGEVQTFCRSNCLSAELACDDWTEQPDPN